MSAIPLILVGGFLGAGKTTLLARAAQRLAASGKRVGLITNDQAAELVDTDLLRTATGSPVCEVSGGCFCCNFEQLLSAADQLIRQHRPDVIIGEPVGSCTDLSATVLQPLKRLHARRFRIAPLSVLLDVRQMQSLWQLWHSYRVTHKRRFPDEVLYIYRKQLEEADLIVLNKVDLVPSPEAEKMEGVLAEHFPEAQRVAMSAQTGRGVDAWLEYVLGSGAGGRRITQVDYDTYARGEAALAWLNAAVEIRSRSPVVWGRFCQDLLESLRVECKSRGAEIAHVKLRLLAAQGTIQANLTSNEVQPVIGGQTEVISDRASLVVNARVITTPEQLQLAIEQALAKAGKPGITARVEHLTAFSPPQPVPAHRFDRVVPAASAEIQLNKDQPAEKG